MKKQPQPYAVITGASSGIGRELAKELAAHGYNLILIARRKQRLIQLQQKLSCNPALKVILMPADVSLESDCYKIADACKEYPVSLVINSAGFGRVGASEKIPLEDELSMIKTNVLGLHLLTRLFADQMTSGTIVNIASMAAFQPSPYFATYAATKAYVLQYSMALNYEMKQAHKPIRVLCLCPGPVKTEFDKVSGGRLAPGAMSARKCAKLTLKAVTRSSTLIIPGISNKCVRLLSKFSPYTLILAIEYYLQKRKTDL